MNFKNILDIIKNPPPPPPKNPPDAIRDFFIWIFSLSFLGIIISLSTRTHFLIENKSFSIPMILSILILVSSWVIFVLRWKGDVPLYVTNKKTGETKMIKHGKSFVSILIFIFISLISYFAIILPINSELILTVSRTDLEERKTFEVYLEKDKRYFVEKEIRNSDYAGGVTVTFDKDSWQKTLYLSMSKNTWEDLKIVFPEDGLYNISFDISDYEKNIKALRFFIKK
jgi:hypothetical protein